MPQEHKNQYEPTCTLKMKRVKVKGVNYSIYISQNHLPISFAIKKIYHVEKEKPTKLECTIRSAKLKNKRNVVITSIRKWWFTGSYTQKNK